MSDGTRRNSSSSSKLLVKSSQCPLADRNCIAFHLLAGTTSGFSSAVLLQPFDLLKTRVQQYSSQNGGLSRASSTSLWLRASRVSSLPVLRALKEIRTEPHPIRQLWRGTLPSVIRTSLGSGLYFASLERLRRMAALSEFKNKQQNLDLSNRTSALPKLSMTTNLTIGALARASVGFIMMPITVLKVRFESDIYTSSPVATRGVLRERGSTQKNPYTGLWTATREIARTEGLRGFFKGAGSTAIRDAPYAGIYLGFYEASKSVLAPAIAPRGTAVDASSSTSALVNFSSGALAAALATTITNPPDVVKTRLQLMPDKYINGFQTIRLMVKEEGLASLWGGLGLRVSRKALSSALAWTVYEEAVRRASAIWNP